MSIDNRFALSGSQDSTLKLWDVVTGKCLHTFTGLTSIVMSVCINADGRFALSGGNDAILRFWNLDWELDDRLPADWDEEALPYLENFLVLHTPYAVTLPTDHVPTQEEVTLALTRQGTPIWTEEDFQNLLYTLGCAGYGWLRPEGVRQQLEAMVPPAQELQAIRPQEMEDRYLYPELGAEKNVANTLNNQAVSLFDSGKQEEALQVWEQALEIQPQHLEATYNRGLVQWRLGIINDSVLVMNLEFARTSLPGVLGGTLGMAMKAHALQASDAFMYAPEQYARDYRPRDWRGEYLLALVHLERDDCEAVLEVLDRIQKTDTENPKIQSLRREARQRLPQSRRLLYTFSGHTDSVFSVCLSADDRFAFSGSKDKLLKLWDVATGECLRTFTGHVEGVSSVCLGADSRFALSGSWDKTLKLWDVATGQCVHNFLGHTDWVFSVCLSADSRLALSGSQDKTLKLWDVVTGECLRTFTGHTDSVFSVCLSKNGQFALSGSRDTTLKLWDVTTGECVRTLTGHANAVRSVCLSANEQFALSGDEKGSVKFWDVASGQCLPSHSGKAVCFSADGRFALSGGWNSLRLLDVATGKCLRTFSEQVGEVTSVCLSTDGQFALSGSKDKALKLWVLGEVNPYIAPMQLSQPPTTETSISPDLVYEQELAQARREIHEKNYVVAAQYIRKVRAINGFNHHPKAFDFWTVLYLYLPRKVFVQAWGKTKITGHTAEVFSVCLSANGQFALSGSNDESLKLWEVATGQYLRTFTGHTRWVNFVCLSANGRFALSGSFDESLKLWEVATGKCLRTFTGHTEGVESVCLSADGRFALSGSNDESLKLWEVATGHCLRTFTGHTEGVKSVCLSANGQFALSGSNDESLKLWEVATGKCLRTFLGHTDWVFSVCLSADGRFALSGSYDESLKLWEVATGQCLRTFEGHTDKVNSVCLNADGRFALSGSGDNTLKLWEVATGHCLRTFTGHTEGVESVCLSADGRFALSGSWDKTIILWDLDWELEDRLPADWDEGARPHLENFLVLHTPYAATLPTDHFPTQEEVTLALTRQGTPIWTEEDFQNLLYTLGCAGYGWLRSEGVHQQLEIMLTNNKDLLSSSKPQTTNNKDPNV